MFVWGAAYQYICVCPSLCIHARRASVYVRAVMCTCIRGCVRACVYMHNNEVSESLLTPV